MDIWLVMPAGEREGSWDQTEQYVFPKPKEYVERRKRFSHTPPSFKLSYIQPVPTWGEAPQPC